MKNKLHVCIILPAIILALFACKPKEVVADTPFGDDPFTTIVGANGMPPLPPNTIYPSIHESLTTYKIYNANNTLLSSFSHQDVIDNNYKDIVLNPNNYVIISHAGYESGRILDLVLTNSSSDSSIYTLRISKNGSIDARNTKPHTEVISPPPRRLVTLKFLYQTNQETVKNKNLAILQEQRFISLQSQLYYYNLNYTNRLYGIDLGDFLKNTIAVISPKSGYPSYQVMETIAISGNPSPFIYLIDAETDGLGEYSLYYTTKPSSNNEFNILSASLDDSPIHNPYPPVTSIVNDETSDYGKKINILLEQYLPEQSIKNYYPVESSFKLSIKENNMSYLDVKESDLKLYIDNTEINISEYALDVTSDESGHHQIDILFRNDFIEKNAGKTIQIKQESEIINEQGFILDSLTDNKLPVNIEANLDYYLPTFGWQNISTPESTSLVSVISDISTEISDDITVPVGTKLSDIPIDSIVLKAVNNSYNWDTIEYYYDNPDLILDDNSTNIKINFVSKTFGNNIIKNVDIKLIDISIDIKGVEQFSWSTDNPIVANSNWVQITIPNLDNYDTIIENIEITGKKNINGDIVSTNRVDMLEIGTTLYLVNVDATIITNDQTYNYTKENIEVPITIKKLNLSARSLDTIILSQSDDLMTQNLKNWVTDVKLEGYLTPESPITEIFLKENNDYNYNVSFKNENLDSNKIGMATYTLVITAETLINGEQTFGPIEIDVTVYINGINVSIPEELKFNNAKSGIYSNQFINRVDEDWTITVNDSRITPENDWRLSVKLIEPFTSIYDESLQIDDILIYRKDGNSHNDLNQDVFINNETYVIGQGVGSKTISYGKDSGFLLKVDHIKSLTATPGSYNSIIQFIVDDVP